MRQRLRHASTALSPERALDVLRQIQHHTVKLGGRARSVIIALGEEQKGLLAPLNVDKPRDPEQLTLL